MIDSTNCRRVPCCAGRRRESRVLPFVVLICLVCAGSDAQAGNRDEFDPFEANRVSHDPFDVLKPAAQVPAPLPERKAKARPVRQVALQAVPALQAAPLDAAEVQDAPAAPPKDPCTAAEEKRLWELGVNIGLPAGNLPTDHASACWDSLASADPQSAVRCWPAFVYDWDATCLAHRPLYFEEINLERYGYGCAACLQPAASAAHFFGTVPALPYLAVAECPNECVYTLGHYRPGSCPPWRHHWPPCDPLAAVAQGGVLTGLIFLIP